MRKAADYGYPLKWWEKVLDVACDYAFDVIEPAREIPSRIFKEKNR